MADAVHDMVVAARWSILRTWGGHIPLESLLLAYKSQVLPFLEHRTPAVYHASDPVPAALNSTQGSLLQQLGLGSVDAMLYFQLAPLSSRRDIAMLGFIHSCVCGNGPRHCNVFCRRKPLGVQGGTRAARGEHSRQLLGVRTTSFSEQVRRSACGLIPVYNVLPEEVVLLPDVRAFQGALQGMLKIAAAAESPSWESVLSPRIPLYRHPLR